MHILTFTSLYPNANNPDFGVFVKNRVLAVHRQAGIVGEVVAPVPYFPPVRIVDKWYQHSLVPRREQLDGLAVCHPRYLVTPKVGMSFYG